MYPDCLFLDDRESPDLSVPENIEPPPSVKIIKTVVRPANNRDARIAVSSVAITPSSTAPLDLDIAPPPSVMMVGKDYSS